MFTRSVLIILIQFGFYLMSLVEGIEKILVIFSLKYLGVTLRDQSFVDIIFECIRFIAPTINTLVLFWWKAIHFLRDMI